MKHICKNCGLEFGALCLGDNPVEELASEDWVQRSIYEAAMAGKETRHSVNVASGFSPVREAAQ